MSATPTNEKIVAEADRRQEELRQQFVHDERRIRQHTLAGNLLHKKVHDIITTPDSNGDDVVVFVYIDSRQTDFRNGDKTTVMIVMSEPKKQRLYFEEVTVKESRYYLADGQVLIKALIGGTYSY